MPRPNTPQDFKLYNFLVCSFLIKKFVYFIDYIVIKGFLTSVGPKVKVKSYLQENCLMY
jgi:hypothetical protein